MIDYNQAISLDPKNIDAYKSRGLIWAAKGDNARAIAEYSTVILLHPKYVYGYLGRGILNFYSGELAKAQADFEQAAKLEPDDIYVAIWLDMAKRRNAMAGYLREAASKLDMTKWPAPVVHMLLGEQTPAAVLAAADDLDVTTKTGQVCEANFYTAELNRLQGHDDEALRLYKIAVSNCPRNFDEYRAARLALRELGMLP
ncbi:hypothetical protein [Mesorhizobium sp.]|uniref:hypothetical protein n=1 Tax=Mesorhizobium sp. TaxID=1871066 RepID=UPI0025C6CDF4|nr:hypothetical protein [Mesorhizobium sp.]